MARLSFRQGIVRHQTDTNNNPTFLQTSGQFVTLLVSPDPTILTFAHGNKDYLYTEHLTQTNAWGPFTPGTDVWLYWELNRITGIRTFEYTTVAPIISAALPLLPIVGQLWFNSTFNVWKKWSGSAWVESIIVMAAKYVNATQFVSVSLDAPNFTGTQVGLLTPVGVGSLVFDTTGKPISTSDNKFFTTEDVFTTGVPTGASLKVNNIIIKAQAQQPIGAYNVVVFSDYNKIVAAEPFTVVNRVYGITEEGTNVGDVVNVVTEGVIFNENWDWSAVGAYVNDPVYIDNTGQISLSPTGGDALPIGAIIDHQSIIFNPTLYNLPQNSGQVVPYDTQFSKVGTITAFDVIGRFVSTRNVTIAGTHVGYCDVAPTGNDALFQVYTATAIAPDTLVPRGAISFAIGSRVADTSAVSTFSIDATDHVIIQSDVPNGIEGAHFTLNGEL